MTYRYLQNVVASHTLDLHSKTCLSSSHFRLDSILNESQAKKKTMLSRSFLSPRRCLRNSMERRFQQRQELTKEAGSENNIAVNTQFAIIPSLSSSSSMIGSCNHYSTSSSLSSSPLSNHFKSIGKCDCRSSLCLQSSIRHQRPNTMIHHHQQQKILFRSFQSESDYHTIADETLEDIQDVVEGTLEDLDIEDFEINYASGVLTMSFGPHGTWVLNKQTPNRKSYYQVNVSPFFFLNCPLLLPLCIGRALFADGSSRKS